jgi:hypothetical protein
MRAIQPSLSTLLAVTILAAAAPSEAQAQRFVPYRGALERDGRPVTATVNMTFRLYAGASGGTALFEQTVSVPVVGGVFATQIGPVGEAVFETAQLFVEAAVEGTTLTGRQLVQASPYALRAQPGQPFRADALVVGAAGGPTATMTVAADGRLTLDTGITLPDGANIQSARLAMVASVPNRNTSNFSAGSLQGTFNDPGGAILLMTSASAFCTSPGRIQIQIRVDGTTVGSMRTYCHSPNVHIALPAAFIRLDRGVIPPPPTGLSVTRTVRLEPINCATGCTAPIVTTIVDGNDFGEVTVLRLPTN